MYYNNKNVRKKTGKKEEKKSPNNFWRSTDEEKQELDI